MVKSYYLDGTNKKAFVIEDAKSKIMFTYATPAVYEIIGSEPMRIWDGFRVNSGKHILKFNKLFTKKAWEAAKVHAAPCTGKFLVDGKTNCVVADFGKKSFLVINGEIMLCKMNDTAKTVYRTNNTTKFYKRYEAYINKFLGKEITTKDWNEFDVKEDLTFV